MAYADIAAGGGAWTIRVEPIDGSAEPVETGAAFGGQAAAFRWSPDGESLITTHHFYKQTWLFDADGGPGTQMHLDGPRFHGLATDRSLTKSHSGATTLRLGRTSPEPVVVPFARFEVGMGSDPLALPPEQMREMGLAVVDMLIARIEGLRDGPVLKTDTLEAMRERLAAQPSSGPRDFGELLRVLDEDVLPFVGHFDHPRFFGYIPGAGTWPAALGDLIAAATMIDAGSWREAAGPSALELTVLDWFRDWVEYPESAAGVLVSGGSAANLTAIACAREALIGPMSPRIVMYTGDQTHSSVARAARHLGFRPDQLRVLPTDDDFRLRPQDVIAAIDADLAADRLPFLVSANAGTTNTGAVDPIGELADACHERGVWLHVDGAYGAFAVLTERGKRAMQGINKADSITLDPHKWLAMPFEVGCLLVREGRLLEQAFELHPEYLKEGHAAPA